MKKLEKEVQQMNDYEAQMNEEWEEITDKLKDK